MSRIQCVRHAGGRISEKDEVFKYLTVVNSAAEISAELTTRIEKSGLERAKNDVFRFVAVAVRQILSMREAVEKRGGSP